MGAAFDAEMRAVVVDLLAEFGKTATLTFTAQGTYNPLTGIGTIGAATVYTLLVSPPSPKLTSFDGGDVVIGTDLTCIADATSLGTNVPRPGQTLTVEEPNGTDVIYTILSVSAILVGQTVAAYELAVRT